MVSAWWRALTAVTVFASGCKGSTATAGPERDSSPATPEVRGSGLRSAGAPLGDLPFKGVVALATLSAKSNYIYLVVWDTPRTCADFRNVGPGYGPGWGGTRIGRSVNISGPWRRGVTDLSVLSADRDAQLEFRNTTMASTQEGMQARVTRPKGGRLEFLETPVEIGSKGRIRFVATSWEGERVEAELPVEICVVDADR